MTEDKQAEIIHWLHSRLPFGSRPGLDRIHALLKALGNPEKKLTTIHIAGTNGKGSVVTLVRCMLEELGLTVGTFTSPYIEVFNERISINGVPIPETDLIEVTEKIAPIVAHLDQDEHLKGATEFEALTAMMFWYFSQQKVDVAIVEVGLGGLMDCTNVIEPEVVGITTIGLDHMDILGSTIEEIARQKAGIIKPGASVVCGKLGPAAEAEIRQKAQAESCPATFYGEDYQMIYQGPSADWGEVFDFIGDNGKIPHLVTPLLGHHQAENAAVAVEIFQTFCQKQQLNRQVKDIRKGMSKANWPGRMEKIMDEPLLLLDGAHNEPAVKRLTENLRSEFQDRKIYLLFGAIATKDVRKMLKEIETLPEYELTLTSFDYPKAFTGEALAAQSDLTHQVYENWQMGLGEILQQATSEDVVVVTGSLYFISQVRAFLLQEEE